MQKEEKNTENQQQPKAGGILNPIYKKVLIADSGEVGMSTPETELERGITLTTETDFDKFRTALNAITKLLKEQGGHELKDDTGSVIIGNKDWSGFGIGIGNTEILFQEKINDEIGREMAETSNPARRIIVIGGGFEGVGLARLIANLKQNHPADTEFLTEDEAALRFPNIQKAINQAKLDKMQTRTDVGSLLTERLDEEQVMIIKAKEQLENELYQLDQQDKLYNKHVQKNFLKAQNRHYNNQFTVGKKYGTKMFKRNKI